MMAHSWQVSASRHGQDDMMMSQVLAHRASLNTTKKPPLLQASKKSLGGIVAVCIGLPHGSAALAFCQVAYEGCLQAARPVSLRLKECEYVTPSPL